MVSDMPVDTPSCSCDICVNMCKRRPCWPSPQEAKAIIDAGFSNRLWLDWWLGASIIYVIGPAAKGQEENKVVSWPAGECTFLTSEGLCELHNLELKPIEARKADHRKQDPSLHQKVAMLWDSLEGRQVVEQWDREIGLENRA